MSKVNELIQQYTSDALEIRRHIHRHPELSMEEKNTTEFISQQLLKYGIEISDIPFKSGVLGILKGGENGHTILLRADIDALSDGRKIRTSLYFRKYRSLPQLRT